MSNITKNNSETTALLASNNILISQSDNRFCGHAITKYDINLIRRVNNVCCICCDDFLKKDSLALTKCMHVFHVECISNFLKKHKTCPLCREEITYFTKYNSKQNLVNNEAVLCDDKICLNKVNKNKLKNNQPINKKIYNNKTCKVLGMCCTVLFTMSMVAIFLFFCIELLFNQYNIFDRSNNSTSGDII